MPELADVAHPVDALVVAPDPAFPPPWPGMPRRLEQLSDRELASWGARFGVDTPYYATPSGFGEWLPVIAWDGIDPPPRDVRVLTREPIRRPVVPPDEAGPLYPHHGLYPRHGLFPRNG